MLYLIPTPIGNIADMSIRSLEVLETCDIILCEDTRISKKLINLLNKRGYLKKSTFHFISYHSHNEEFKISSFEEDFFANNIALLSDAGTPCISDPGVKLIAFAKTKCIPYTILPGASSLTCAMALSGFEGEFAFFAFLPHKMQDKHRFLHRILDSTLNAVCFESPHRILDSIKFLSQIAGDREIFLAKELTKIHEKFYFGTINDVYLELQNQNLNGEWIMVLKGSKDTNKKSLDINDITSLFIPPKIKAKLLSKLSDKSVQECYDNIIKS